jgi:5'-3' exonuclease
MGIKGLNTFIKSIKNNKDSFASTVHLSVFKGKTVAIDFTNQAHRFLYRDASEYVYLLEFINLIHKFQKYGVKLIFVFDGKPLVEKQYAIEHRRAYRNKLFKKIDELNAINNYDDQTNIIKHLIKKTNTLNIIIIQECKKLFNYLKIPYIHIDYIEADTIFKYLLDKKLADACFTADTDVIAYGCHTILKDLDYIHDTLYCIKFEKMLSILDITHEEFVYTCILSGTDYNNSLKNSKLEINLSLIKKYKTISGIIDNLDEINNSLPVEYKKSFPTRFDWQIVFKIFTDEISCNMKKQICDYLSMHLQNSFNNSHYEQLQNYLIQQVQKIDKGFKYSRKFIEIVSSKFNIEIKC